MAEMYESNKRIYQSRDVVARYAAQSALQEPEKTILEILRPGLASMKMLDLGVGAGRTTVHFAPLVREYVGVDCSPEMIAACEKRFPGEKLTFQTRDVRSGTGFADHAFDLVLFSFNGIDTVEQADRMEVLKIIRRAVRPGGYFVFSAHNLQSVQHRLGALRLSALHPVRSLDKLFRFALIRALNRGVDEKIRQPHCVVRDTLRLMTYHVGPAEQIRQLAESGFASARVFSLLEGKEITGSEELSWIDDKWLYYLCQ